MATLPTVKVHFKSGKFGDVRPAIINERDFDPKLHMPWEQYEYEKSKRAEEKAAPKPDPVKSPPKKPSTKSETARSKKVIDIEGKVEKDDDKPE